MRPLLWCVTCSCMVMGMVLVSYALRPNTVAGAGLLYFAGVGVGLIVGSSATKAQT